MLQKKARILSQEFRNINIAREQLRDLAAEKIGAGQTHRFAFPGHPEFRYVVLNNQDFDRKKYPEAEEHLENRTAVAIHKTSNSHHEFGNHDAYYLIVHGRLGKNARALAALHEWTEVETGEHFKAASAEREFARTHGMTKNYYLDKFGQARQMAKAKTILSTQATNVHGDSLYELLVKEIVQQTALKRREVQHAIVLEIAEHARKRQAFQQSLKSRKG